MPEEVNPYEGVKPKGAVARGEVPEKDAYCSGSSGSLWEPFCFVGKSPQSTRPSFLTPPRTPSDLDLPATRDRHTNVPFD